MTAADLPDWTENRAPDRWLPSLRLGEIWSSRELSYFFFLRDLKSGYKQTVLGITWVILGPLIGAISYTFVFNGLAGIETEGSYFALALTGFIVWRFVNGVMQEASGSLLEHEDLITHVSFPMIAAPVSVVLLATVDLAVGSVIAAGWSIVTGSPPSLLGVLVGLPAALVLMVLTAMGPGLLFAPAVVKYRDAGSILGLGSQVLFVLGPVAYPPELLGDRFQTIVYLNPVAGCVALYRWALTGAPAPEPAQLAISVGVALTAALVGLVSFRRNEHLLVDVI
ncbi:MAG: ABC transporter permease [Actinomycetota bacterium]